MGRQDFVPQPDTVQFRGRCKGAGVQTVQRVFTVRRVSETVYPSTVPTISQQDASGSAAQSALLARHLHRLKSGRLHTEGSVVCLCSCDSFTDLLFDV